MKTAHWHALLLTGAGVMHFKAPQVYDAIVPRCLPRERAKLHLGERCGRVGNCRWPCASIDEATGRFGRERVVCRGLPREHQDGRGLSQGRQACGRTGTCVCSATASDSSDSRGVEGVSRKYQRTLTSISPRISDIWRRNHLRLSLHLWVQSPLHS